MPDRRPAAPVPRPAPADTASPASDGRRFAASAEPHSTSGAFARSSQPARLGRSEPGLRSSLGDDGETGLSIPLPTSSSASAWSEGDTRPPEDEDVVRRPPAMVAAITALAYALIGLLALLVAIAPGYASPLYPSAGIGLAAALMFGRSGVAGVFFGALLVNLTLGGLRGLDSASAWAVPGVIAAGAALQAAVGAGAVRRFVSRPLTLTEPADIARFFMVGALSTLVSATAATGVLWITGAVSAVAAPVTFITWWSGDAIGVMIGAPIALTLIGRPRGAWAVRRGTVGLAMGLATVVMTLAIVQAERWNQHRERSVFEQQAQTALSALRLRVADAVQAADAAAALQAAAPSASRESLALLASEWLREPASIDALGFYERQPRNGDEQWLLRTRAPASGGPLPPSLPADVGRGPWPVGPGPGPGSGPGSGPRPGAFVAVQPGRQAQPSALWVGRLVFTSPARAAEGAAGAVGALLGTVRLDTLVDPVLKAMPAGTVLCLTPVAEAGAPLSPGPVYGPASCARQDATDEGFGPAVHQRLSAAGLELQVQWRPRRGSSVGFGEANVWLLSMIGLVGTAMFGALMLTVTGRSRRIAVAVKSRTAQLEAQIRERARTELALRDSEQRFRNILNTVPIGILYTDLNGQVRQANPKFCELLGFSADELAELRVQDFTEPQDWRAEAELLGQLIRGETPGYRLRKRYVARNGQRIWVQSVVSALRDDSGESRRIVGVAEDITEQLRLAESERARESAEAANRAKSDFLSRMSHELRTPLNAMLGFAQLLEMDPRSPLTPNQRPWVGQIQQAGWHLLEMINDVLDLSRIESGTLRLQTQDIDLAEQVEASLALVAQEAQRRGLSLSHTLEPGARRVRGDSTRVRQVLTNLLTNAVKYNVERGSVRIMARALGDRAMVEVVVADTGLGMTPEQLAQLFQPFNRLGRERSAREGTGIGLVISQRLAELMGGSLTARSVAGQGSAFMLRLPAAQTVATELPQASDAEPVSHDYHRRRVLYIEDNATNVEVMRGILAQRPQVKLTVAMTGLDGLAALRAEPVDLLLLDLHLPDIDGLEVLRRLREDSDLAHIPVVAVSADAMTSQIDATLAAGAQDYLTKPVSVSELLRVVDQLLDEADTAFG